VPSSPLGPLRGGPGGGRLHRRKVLLLRRAHLFRWHHSLPFDVRPDRCGERFYGKEGARRLTYAGLAAALFVWGTINLALLLPTVADSPFRTRFFAAPSVPQRVSYLASLTAYMIGQSSISPSSGCFVRLTGQRLLWLRSTGSTVLSTSHRQYVGQLRVPGGHAAHALHRVECRQQLRRQADHGRPAHAPHLLWARTLPSSLHMAEAEVAGEPRQDLQVVSRRSSGAG